MKRVDKEVANIQDALEASADPSLVDASEQTTQFQDLVDAVVDKVRETGKPVDTNTGHSILSAKDYEGFTPDIRVTKNNSGFSSQETAQQFKVNDPLQAIAKNPNRPVRTADDIDLSKLDESTAMDLPFISVAEYKLTDMLNLAPKDPAIRFRWVNFKNYVAGNMGRLAAIGFQVASIDDVDTVKTPVDASMIDGTQVIYYDIKLMKVNVLRLMSLYKRNVITSLGRIRNFQKTGEAAANKQLMDDISGNPALLAGLRKMMIANQGEQPIEFYDPGA